MLKRHWFLVVLSLLLLAQMSGTAIAGNDAAASERILRFTSRVVVKPDAALTVTETIEVRATGDQIKRGIVREFPSVYTDRFGHRVKVGVKVLEARRDGAPESYRVESVAERKKFISARRIFSCPPGSILTRLNIVPPAS